MPDLTQTEIISFKDGLNQNVHPRQLKESEVADWKNVIYLNGELSSDFAYEEPYPEFPEHVIPVKIKTVPYCNDGTFLFLAFCNHIGNTDGNYDSALDYGQVYYYYPLATGDAWVLATVASGAPALPLFYGDYLQVEYYKKLQTTPTGTLGANKEILEDLDSSITMVLFCGELTGSLWEFRLTQTADSPITVTGEVDLYIKDTSWYIKGFTFFKDRFWCWGHDYYRNKIIWSDNLYYRKDLTSTGGTIEFNQAGFLYRENILTIYSIKAFAGALILIHSNGMQIGEYIGQENYLIRYHEISAPKLFAYSIYNSFELTPSLSNGLITQFSQGIACATSREILVLTTQKTVQPIPNAYAGTYFSAVLPTAIANSRIVFRRLLYHEGLKQLFLLYHRYQESALEVPPTVDITQTLQEYEDAFWAEQGVLPSGYEPAAFPPADPATFSPALTAGSREFVFTTAEWERYSGAPENVESLATYAGHSHPQVGFLTPPRKILTKLIEKSAAALSAIGSTGDSVARRIIIWNFILHTNVDYFRTFWRTFRFFERRIAPSNIWESVGCTLNILTNLWFRQTDMNTQGLAPPEYSQYADIPYLESRLDESQDTNKLIAYVTLIHNRATDCQIAWDTKETYQTYGTSAVTRQLKIHQFVQGWGTLLDPYASGPRQTKQDPYKEAAEVRLAEHQAAQEEKYQIFLVEQAQRRQRILNIANENPRFSTPLEDLSLVEASGVLRYDLTNKLWYNSIIPKTEKITDMQFVEADTRGRVTAVTSQVNQKPYPEIILSTDSGKLYRYQSFNMTLIQNTYLETKLFKLPNMGIRLASITLLGSLVSNVYIYFRESVQDSWDLLGITDPVGRVTCNLSLEYFQFRIGNSLDVQTAINFKFAAIELSYLQEPVHI